MAQAANLMWLDASSANDAVTGGPAAVPPYTLALLDTPRAEELRGVRAASCSWTAKTSTVSKKEEEGKVD